MPETIYIAELLTEDGGTHWRGYWEASEGGPGGKASLVPGMVETAPDSLSLAEIVAWGQKARGPGTHHNCRWPAPLGRHRTAPVGHHRGLLRGLCSRAVRPSGAQPVSGRWAKLGQDEKFRAVKQSTYSSEPCSSWMIARLKSEGLRFDPVPGHPDLLSSSRRFRVHTR